MAMGQNPVPPVNIPIPTKIGSIMGGEFTYQPKRDPIASDPISKQAACKSRSSQLSTCRRGGDRVENWRMASVCMAVVVKKKKYPKWLALVNGKDSNLRCPGGLILSHTHMGLSLQMREPHNKCCLPHEAHKGRLDSELHHQEGWCLERRRNAKGCWGSSPENPPTQGSDISGFRAFKISAVLASGRQKTLSQREGLLKVGEYSTKTTIEVLLNQPQGLRKTAMSEQTGLAQTGRLISTGHILPDLLGALCAIHAPLMCLVCKSANRGGPQTLTTALLESHQMFCSRTGSPGEKNRRCL